MRRLIVFLMVGVTGHSYSLAQTADSTQVKFLTFLLNGEHYDDLFAQGDVLTQRQSLTAQQAYILGKGGYISRRLELGVAYLNRVEHTDNNLLHSAYLLKALMLAENQQQQKAFNQFSTLAPTVFDTSVYRFYNRGLALLARNIDHYRQTPPSQASCHSVYHQDTSLNSFALQLQNHRPRSMWMAGGLSALVPGLGKVYAGRSSEGLATFLVLAGLFVQVYEGYALAGNNLNNWRSIAFGSIFSAYYIANIWGSALSVKIRNYEFNESIDRQILIQLHLPVRRLLFGSAATNRR